MQLLSAQEAMGGAGGIIIWVVITGGVHVCVHDPSAEERAAEKE